MVLQAERKNETDRAREREKNKKEREVYSMSRQLKLLSKLL